VQELDRYGEITNDDLTASDVPAPDAGWQEIGRFALSFNGYEWWGSFQKCAEVANLAVKTYRESGVLPESLTDLRTCLFFEQRRWRHFGFDPDEEAMRYISALLEAIRESVLAGEIARDSGEQMARTVTRRGRSWHPGTSGARSRTHSGSQPMTSRMSDQQYLVGDQYKDATKLRARVQLRERFSTNKGGWMPWFFDHLCAPAGGRILEPGCGAAKEKTCSIALPMRTPGRTGSLCWR
jgi:hypothetical protein